MMRLPHPYALFLSCAFALISAGGCEDSQARQRAEVQKIIEAATEQLSAAAAVRVDPQRQDQLRRDLGALITKLANTSGGEPGQQAAAARLAGNAHRMLASLDLTQAERLEADHRSRRWVVDGMIDAALELDAVAAAREAIDVSGAQDRLAEDSDAAGAQLQEHSEHMATLDGPIADIRRRNRDDRDEAERLREEASQLRREASELGPGEGYTTFERSLQLDRQADQIEYEVARRELELRFILEPEHEVAQKRIDQARSRIQTDEGAEEGLEDATRAMSADARSTRAGVDELGEQIAAALSEIEQVSTGTLTELYDRGGSNLEKAAAKAKSAATMARGEGTDAARVESARAYQQLGDMYWLKARGLDQDIALRQRLADHADALGGAVAGPGGQSLASLHEAHRAALAEATAAYNNAQSVLEQVSGRTARRRLEALRARMSALIEEEPPAVTPALDRGPSRAEAPAPAVTADGAASPEALVEALRNAGDLESFTDLQFDFTHIEFETATAAEIYEASMDANLAMVELDKAMQEQLGAGLGVPDVSLGQVSGDRAAMTITLLGQAQPVELIRVNEMWYLDGTGKFNAQIAQAAAMGLDETAVLTMAQTQAAAIRQVVDRVRAGEFSSVPETMGALGQAMMQAMQGLQGQ